MIYILYLFIVDHSLFTISSFLIYYCCYFNYCNYDYYHPGINLHHICHPRRILGKDLAGVKLTAARLLVISA